MQILNKTTYTVSEYEIEYNGKQYRVNHSPNFEESLGGPEWVIFDDEGEPVYGEIFDDIINELKATIK